MKNLGHALVKVIQVKLPCKVNDSVIKIATHIIETFLAICTANQGTISKCSDTNERTFNTSIENDEIRTVDNLLEEMYTILSMNIQ